MSLHHFGKLHVLLVSSAPPQKLCWRPWFFTSASCKVVVLTWGALHWHLTLLMYLDRNHHKFLYIRFCRFCCLVDWNIKRYKFHYLTEELACCLTKLGRRCADEKNSQFLSHRKLKQLVMDGWLPTANCYKS